MLAELTRSWARCERRTGSQGVSRWGEAPPFRYDWAPRAWAFSLESGAQVGGRDDGHPTSIGGLSPNLPSTSVLSIGCARAGRGTNRGTAPSSAGYQGLVQAAARSHECSIPTTDANAEPAESLDDLDT